MPTKIVNTEQNGIKIQVVNTWFNGARLYVNGECVDKNGQLFSTSKDLTFLEHKLLADGNEYHITVYCVAWFYTKLKICINGVFVAGDNF